MKQIARYKIQFDSLWITGSAMLTGAAMFLQAFYFLAMGKYQTSGGGYLALFMIIPMILEIAWFVLLKGVKLNAAGIYGILAGLMYTVVAIQNYFGDSVLLMVFGTIACLVLSGGILMITGGYFPYKLAGVAAFAAVLLIRFFAFDMGRYIRPRDWQGFMMELPALCILASIMLFCGGITRVGMPQE